MRHRSVWVVSLAAATMLVTDFPILAVYNGQADGNGHPAVGFILGTKGPDPCDRLGQAIGCSGVLIAPDVFLSTGDCAFEWQDHVDTGFVDAVWVIIDPNPLLPDVPITLDCSKFIGVTAIDANPVYLNDFDKNEGDVGVLILATAQTGITPAGLPAARRLKRHPRRPLPDITTVSFGLLADPSHPTGFGPGTLARRSDHAVIGGIGPELHDATLDPVPDSPQPCIGRLAEGGANFVTGTDEIVSLVRFPAGTCDNPASFQRLDVRSVRRFLADHVTVP